MEIFENILNIKYFCKNIKVYYLYIFYDYVKDKLILN